ncbi:MAG TPA: hypothetical protein VEK33_22930 [Terriglobales bacterium]|nr:hypothetical protein [Terriglobales bacterium]
MPIILERPVILRTHRERFAKGKAKLRDFMKRHSGHGVELQLVADQGKVSDLILLLAENTTSNGLGWELMAGGDLKVWC